MTLAMLAAMMLLAAGLQAPPPTPVPLILSVVGWHPTVSTPTPHQSPTPTTPTPTSIPTLTLASSLTPTLTLASPPPSP